jgi:midasin (ATPase involved in ribosome maturation)
VPPAWLLDITFFNIPSHTHVLENLLKDFLLGEHLLLVGNQGVGKNKLADRLLQLMRREREYIQLHRDTTVSAITVLPSLVDGVVVWLDSPLVKAMRFGRVLMIDEVDKAATEVVCVLKGLFSDGELVLSDGRRFVTSKSPLYSIALPCSEDDNKAAQPISTTSTTGSAIFRVHSDFRVFALANPPGYPFLGHDFFHELGDVFAAHAIDNVDQTSEMALLKSYAPRVSEDILARLTTAFADLRRLNADSVQISLPFALRVLADMFPCLIVLVDDFVPVFDA